MTTVYWVTCVCLRTRTDREQLPMPIEQKLLDILCCPVTKQPVFPLTEADLALVNDAIAAGKVCQVDDSPVETPLTEGLITRNRQHIYRIDDGIPVMLEDESIPVDQIQGL